MFTGIVESQSPILQVTPLDSALQIVVKKPIPFDDLKVGDSIACNGICLTLEKFDDETIQFTIGHETIEVTGWDANQLEGRFLNLERSLRFGDRIHGHLVSGHVDALGTLKQKKWQGECLLLTVEVPDEAKKYIWKKGSVALNGVSLTVNFVNGNEFEVCLIPETLKQTNLEKLNEGDKLNLETDYYLKGMLNAQGATNA